MQPISFTATDGYILKGLWALPVDTYKGTVIINSATSIKKEFYIRFAQYLVQNGYRVLLYDYRGIGQSAPTSLKGFTAYMHEWGTKDMNGALNFVVNEKEGNNIIWIGHSVGAQMMGLLDQRHKIKKVMAINASIGYWNYFTPPYNIVALFLWNIVGPFITLTHGYAPMHKIGWGEPLPTHVYFEWRKWCMNKHHFKDFLQQQIGLPHFTDFTASITAIHTSDDYIANKKTVAKLLAFYPNSTTKTICINPTECGFKKIGHTAIFRSRHEKNIWPLIVEEMEG
jgi:predicted alpha/beta hydrolase